MIKPNKLHYGDTIATISPSWGIAGEKDALWFYELGKKRLQNELGLNVIEAPNSLRGEEYLKNNPKARAEDLMWAFVHPYSKYWINKTLFSNDAIGEIVA